MSRATDDILKFFERTGDQFFSKKEFVERLNSGRQLRIKYGVDVTAPTLHIGHAVNLWLMRYLQGLGHKVVFLIGDYTTRIGDPDGRMETRPVIPREDIEKNAKAFIDQARMILRFDDPGLIEVRYNSEWFDKMPASHLMELLSQVTHARLISRDMFQKRIAQKKDIHAHELIYPVLQGWDSVMVKSDLAIIGSDQLFNEMMGRFFQEKQGQKPQTLVTTKITMGTDGKHKQSKSLGNYIGLADSPRDKFGRVMSIPDELIEDYFRVYTDVPLEQIDAWADDIARHPRHMKAKLAYAIVGRYHGHEVAAGESDWFDKTFSKRKVPEDIPVITVYHHRLSVLELAMLAHPEKSKSAMRRLIAQGAVELNDEKFTSPDSHIIVKNDDILKIGKREWFRILVVEMNEFVSERLLMRPMQVEDIDLISRTLPQWEIVKYLGVAGAAVSQREADRIAAEVFKRVILKPEPKDEWIWTVALKDKPDQLVGLAHLRKDDKQGNQNIWLADDYKTGNYAEEVLEGINEYAFTNHGMDSMMFKNAFAHASAPQELEVLRKRFIAMDATARNREDPMGSWGFTKEGWLLMKQQLRQLTPEMNTLMADTVAVVTKKKKIWKEKSAKQKKPTQPEQTVPKGPVPKAMRTKPDMPEPPVLQPSKKPLSEGPTPPRPKTTA